MGVCVVVCSVELQIVDDETLDDIDGFAEEAEDWRDAGGGDEADSVEDHEDDAIERIDPKKLQAEIDELTRYRDLAMSIADNAKGRALLDCLPHVLTEIVGKGGQSAGNRGPARRREIASPIVHPARDELAGVSVGQ